MTSLFDACFLINVKRTDLHKYWHQIFPHAVISSQIEFEIVTKGIEYNKNDAILTQQQIQEGTIQSIAVPEEKVVPIEKVLHLGEASLLALVEILQEDSYLIGTDDIVFWRYLSYVYPLKSTVHCLPFTTLDRVIELYQTHAVSKKEARILLQQFDKIGAHSPEAILAVYSDIEESTLED